MHIRRATLLVIGLPFLAAVVAAYVQRATMGLPPVVTSVHFPGTGNPQGFHHVSSAHLCASSICCMWLRWIARQLAAERA